MSPFFSFQRESALVLYDGEIVSLTLGTYGSVEFNFLKVWQYRMEKGKEFQHHLLHLIHVHPPGVDQPSSLDEECAEGWYDAFACSHTYSIVQFVGNFLGYAGYAGHSIKTFTFNKPKRRLVEESPAWISIHHLRLLKYLSYAESSACV